MTANSQQLATASDGGEPARWAPLLRWTTRLALAAASTAALELAVLGATVPFVGSDGVGTLHLFVGLVATYALAGLPAMALCLALERRVLPRLARHGAEMASATLGVTLGAVVATAAVAALHQGIAPADEVEFTVPLELIRNVATMAVLLATGLASVWAARRARGLVAEPAGQRALCRWLGLGFMALGLTLAYRGLGPILLVRLSALAGLVTVWVALLVARSWLGAVPLRDARIASGLLAAVVLLAPLSSCRDPHARFALFTHSHMAGGLASRARDVVDLDGDGAASALFGGADCAELDATRGPGRRDTPGDGIDQDCSGADAAPVERAAPSRTPWPGCAGPRPGTSVVLITIDALQSRILSPRIAPALTQFAQSATIYRRAYSPAASTMQSMAAVFSGHPVAALFGEAPLGHFLGNDKTFAPGRLFAPRMVDAGYTATAINLFQVPPALLVGFEPPTQPIDTFPRGPKHDFASAAVTNLGLEAAARARGPQLLWLHYPDAHAPYLHPGDTKFRPGEVSAYEREIAYVDFHVGRLLAGLSDLGMLAESIVAITSDHGEELGLHGREGHFRDVYETSIHVPLLLHVPGCPLRQVEEPVSLTHLLPTIGALLGVDVPGHTLLPQATAPPVVSETIDAEVFKRAIVVGPHKLMVDVRNGGRLLFDVLADPDEGADLYAARPDLAEAMERAYQAYLDQAYLDAELGPPPAPSSSTPR